MITAEDIAQWRGNPVTKMFKEILASDRLKIMEAWANGNYRGDALLAMQGKADLLGDILRGIDEIGERVAEAGEEVAQ